MARQEPNPIPPPSILPELPSDDILVPFFVLHCLLEFQVPHRTPVVSNLQQGIDSDFNMGSHESVGDLPVAFFGFDPC